MTQLPIIAKKASEVAEQAQILSDSLKDLAMTVSQQAPVTAEPLIFSITIFVLSCFVGYYLVWKVTPALHTPLMSITNAISGIIIIGSMMAAGVSGLSISAVLGFIATFFAAINIFGGFIVTTRMLEMFKKRL